MIAVQLNNISKSYEKGKVVAVNDISFDIEKAELFGLIGPDGAGKTTLFRVLTTLILADKGTAFVDGLDVVKDFRKIRERVGYMPGRFSLYQDLTVQENIDFFATIFNTSLQENYFLVKEIWEQIEPFKNRRAGKLSGGMKQKLALCCALIHKPSVLFLDEPTTGVDAVSRKEFWEMLKRLKQQGITILVSTPYMDEANLCDRVALIQNGNILDIDKPEKISASFSKPLMALRSDEMYRLLQDVRSFDITADCYPFGDHHHLVLKNKTDVNVIEIKLKELNHRNIEVHTIDADIEDSFIYLMKNKIQEKISK